MNSKKSVSFGFSKLEIVDLKKRLFINLVNEKLDCKMTFKDICELFEENEKDLIKMSFSEFEIMLYSYIHNRTMGLKKC